MNTKLSDAALALLRYRLATKDKTVTDTSLDAYRELARGGIMYPVSTFLKGPESIFRWKDEGWARFRLGGGSSDGGQV